MIRLEHGKVLAWHPYRTFDPWSNGFTKVIMFDSVNDRDKHAQVELKHIEDMLHAEAASYGIKTHPDNHHGFLIASSQNPNTQFYYRFSDGLCWVLTKQVPPHLDIDTAMFLAEALDLDWGYSTDYSQTFADLTESWEKQNKVRSFHGLTILTDEELQLNRKGKP